MYQPLSNFESFALTMPPKAYD